MTCILCDAPLKYFHKEETPTERTWYCPECMTIFDQDPGEPVEIETPANGKIEETDE